jgi:predicted lactoylglutathione lyase
MLLTLPKFRQFTDKSITDARKSAEVIVALGAESKEDVDRIADAALKAGGKEPRPPQDYGFMFLRTFADLDGHLWEVAWMNPAAMQQ